MMNLLGYIAGAYRDRSIWKIRQNIREAESVASRFIEAGVPMFIPHKNTGLLDGLVPDREFLRQARVVLRRCDFMVVLPSWVNSMGTREEINDADELGIPFVAWSEPFEDVVAFLNPLLALNGKPKIKLIGNGEYEKQQDRMDGSHSEFLVGLPEGESRL